MKVNANWYFTKQQKIIAIIQWLKDKIETHIHIRRKIQRNYFIHFDQIFQLFDNIYVDVDHERNIRRNYDNFIMKSFDLYNEFYFKFVLLTNQLFNKFETNKIHNLKKKLIIKFKLIMNNLNDYTFFWKFSSKNSNNR